MHPDFAKLECVYDAGKTVVHRGARDEAGRPVVLKSLRASFPSQRRLDELRHEHRVLTHLAELGVEGVIRSRGLFEHDARLVLATEDTGADSLRVALDTGRWRPAQTLDTAIAIADALAAVHDAGYIHKDLNPANILCDERTGAVKLLDFGISVRAERDQARAEALEGTLAYISPEQTGRMNRFVDWRSDLYSLGATLYELLTSQPPFGRGSALELVHAHIAVRPRPPAELDPSVDPLLSQIVMRLLEKNAEDRYQSAYGLRADLLRLREGLAAGELSDFPLGTRDLPRFRVADRLYGRESETAWLLAQFERAAAGETVLALVGGYSGVGKTSLVREVQRPIVERRGAFLAGKFDQFNRGLPYASLSDAFDRFVVQLLTLDEGERAAWAGRIVAATAGATRLICDVVPHLEALVGAQPEVPELAESDAENRFNVVFGRFVGALATADHPLVLFLDDLQWADLPTLRIIEGLAAELEAKHLLVVGAYRDNEVGPAHPLRAMLARLGKASRRASELVLEPLALAEVEALVAGAHRQDPATTAELAALCFEKTSGNPFFLNQFLGDLHEQGLIRFDREAGRWTWDLAAIQARAYTSNVVEFMARRVAVLPEAVLEVLAVGAVLGNEFAVAELAAVLERGVSELMVPLEQAQAAGLLFLEGRDEARASFVHDRVQQAAYETLDGRRRVELHATIGALLADRVAAGDEGVLFDAVTHLSRARAQLPAATRQRLAELAVRAASVARASSAYGPAAEFATTALECLPGDDPLRQRAHVERAHASFLTGDYPTMDASIDAVLGSDAAKLLEVEMLELRGQAHNARNNLLQAIEVNLEGLAMLGVELPALPGQGKVLAELLETKLALRGKSREQLSRLPICTDLRDRAAMRLLMNLVGAAYYASPNLIPLLAFNTVRLSLERGVSAESATGFAVYGLVLCTLGDLEGGYAHGQIAEAIAERFPGERHTHRSLHMYNTHIRFWVEPWDVCAEALRLTHEGAYAGGDFEFAAFSGFMRCALLAARGGPLGELLPEMERMTAALAQMQQETSGYTLAMVRQTVLNLRGEASSEPWQLRGPAYDEREAVPAHEQAKDTTNLFCYQVQIQKLAYLFGRPDLSLAAAKAAAPLEEAAASTYFIVEAVFYEALARAAMADQLRGIEAIQNRIKLLALERRLRKFRAASEINVGACATLIQAERERLFGRTGAALLSYERAARQAAEHGWTHVEGIALERAARLQRAESNHRSAETLLKGARFAYDRWGATGVVERLVEEFPFAAARHGGSVEGTLMTVSAGESIDLEAAMRAARTISSQIVVADLLGGVLEIVVQSAGAEGGALLLSEGEEPVVAAQTRPDFAYSRGIVRVVQTTGEPVVLDDALTDPRFASDPHVLAHKPLSVLCAPLEHAGRTRGLVYLENNLTRGAFTPDRLQLLQLLAAQAAVSLENAQLVDNLEAKVRERTRQLEQRNEYIRRTFGRYVSDEIVSALLDQPEGTSLGGELREVTVMLADLRGFSTAVRKLPPQAVLAVVNNFLEVQTRVVLSYGGTIDEVLGDALLVLFGAPIAGDDDQDRAVACAIAMQQAMAEVNAANAAQGLPQLAMGIGVHTGEAVVGNIGTEDRAKYGVVGSVVNMAARIESLTRGGQILISQQVRERVSAKLETLAEREFEPKGAPAPLRIFEVAGIGAPFDLRLVQTEAPLTTISPVEVALSEITDVEIGPRQRAELVGVARDRVVLRGLDCAPHHDVRLFFDFEPDAQIYGKVVGEESGAVTVAYTSVSDSVLEQLERLR
ncbi:MAG: AAA family ATPase [Enhygromyxa sp.]